MLTRFEALQNYQKQHFVYIKRCKRGMQVLRLLVFLTIIMFPSSLNCQAASVSELHWYRLWSVAGLRWTHEASAQCCPLAGGGGLTCEAAGILALG